MPTKVLENRFALSLLCILTGIIVVLNTSLITAPVRVSEKGIVMIILSFCLIALGLRLLKRSMIKV